MLTGGARSGKSQLAVALATRQPAPVVVVATGEAGDDEMAARIQRHRQARPVSWTTVEEPLDLAGALDRVPAESFVLID
ncbi:MAG: bifunctional adenosylcobinamide kinase/adenosylcobinamide-phosphate guanylyltransferase, partial [Acidimicrobiia bacterium]|nr:bifunctional adenosylcobinamide kinase/adenosylcobinamide-phosphate guanylyltransferase [Acidimicrobiia bacterium]